MAWTKEKRAEYMKIWRTDNKQHIKDYRRKYYLKHLMDSKTLDNETNTANARRWRDKNREHYNTYMREYRKRKVIEKQLSNRENK